MEKTEIYSMISKQVARLTFTGIWPHKNTTNFYKLRGIFTYIVEIIFVTTHFIELEFNISEADYLHMFECGSFLITLTIYLFKRMIFMIHTKHVQTLTDNIQLNSFNNYPMECDVHVKNSLKSCNMVITGFNYVCYSVVGLSALKPFFMEFNLAFRFEKYDLGEWRIPFYFFQVSAMALMALDNSSLDLSSMGFMSVAESQFYILRDKLLHLREWIGRTYENLEHGYINENNDEFNDEIDDELHERIKECIKHHMDIIEYAGILEKTYCYYFLLQFFNSVLAICSTFFHLRITEGFINYCFAVSYLVALLLELGIYCVFGNGLMLSSLEIKEACYMSKWYNCSPQIRKSLFIIMERSKRPIVLTAGKFSVLNLETYSNLLQASYKYFAIMNKVYSES